MDTPTASIQPASALPYREDTHGHAQAAVRVASAEVASTQREERRTRERAEASSPGAGRTMLRSKRAPAMAAPSVAAEVKMPRYPRSVSV